MLGRGTRLLFLAGRGHAKPSFLPTLLRLACTKTPQAAASVRRYLRLSCGENRSLDCETYPDTLGQKKQGLLVASCCSGLSGNVRPISDTNGTLNTRSAVELGLIELKMKLERLGRLNLNDVNQVVVSLEHDPEQLSDADCLRLLQYCCRMAEEEYRPCGSLVQRVWALTTHRHSGQVTLEHLMLYLHLCLTVESTTISKRDILDVMDRHKLEPNASVFEALMSALGQRGHLEQTLQVLAALKECNLPVREATFAALILAYGADRNWEGVQGVLDTMRSVQMSQSEVTYGALATASAMLGQMARLRQVVEKARQDGKPLSAGQLEAILLALIRRGNAGEHFENIDTVLKLVEECDMKVDVSRVALQLIHSGQVREAVHLLLSFPLLRTNNHLYSNAAIYLREIVHARTDPGLVVEVCHWLQREDISRYALQVALEHALRERWEQLAWVLLRAMREAGLPFREHYFWPLLHLKAISLEPTKLLECVQTMLELGKAPGFETLRDHIIPCLSLSQPSLTLQTLQNTGLSARATAAPLLLVLVKNNMMDHAIKFVQETKAPLNLEDIIRTLAPAWHSNPKSIIFLLALLMQRRNQSEQPSSVNEEDWGGQFLLSLAATRVGLGVHHIRPLFQELKKYKIGVSEYSADLLVNRLSRLLQEAVKANLPLVLCPGLGQPPLEKNKKNPHPNSMSEEELEGHLEELRTKELNTRGSLRRLLLLRAAKNDTAGVMELMQRASEEGKQLSAGMLAGVLMAYVSSGNVKAAMDMLARLNAEHPGFTVDSYKVVDLCTLLIQKGRSPEAVDILQGYIMKNSRKNINPNQIKGNCRNLLMTSANSGSSKETEKLFDLLLLGGFVVPDKVSLGALVKSRLNSGDLKGAVEEARRIQEHYKCLPMRREVLIHLIGTHQDANSETRSADSHQLMEDMLSLIAEVSGSASARHDLLFAYVEAGQHAAASKVLKNLAELNQGQVNRQLEYYIKNENEAAVVHLLSASRGINVIDRQPMYLSLLNIYYVQNEGKKALSLWTSMQEEGLTPSPTFLSTLAALLATCKIKIPFQI